MVLVIGSVNVDYVTQVNHLSVPARGFERVPSGKGGNQALAARRAGLT